MYLQRIEKVLTKVAYHSSRIQVSKHNNSVPIIAYHEICDLPKEINRLHLYNVSPSAFKEQMDFLHKNNYSVIKLEELISCLIKKEELPRKSLVITFDDGYKNNYTNAFPILKQYDFPATIFLATNYMGSNKVFPWLNGLRGMDEELKENLVPLSWQEILKMSQDGITFGSHTSSHSNIRKMDGKKFEDELRRSKDTIENRLHKKVELFSHPFSFPKYRAAYRKLINESRTILIRNGFIGACTTIIGNNSYHSDPFCLKRIQIKNTDDLFQFKAKIEGAYNWMGLAQRIYQKIIEPLIEKSRGASFSH